MPGIAECYRNAVYALVQDGTIHDRLLQAGSSLAPAHTHNVADHLRQMHLAIFGALTSTPPKGDEGGLAATVSALPENRARVLARAVIHGFEAVSASGNHSEGIAQDVVEQLASPG